MIPEFAPELKSAIQGIQWPAIPDQEAANTAAVLYQLEKSQWWPENEMLAMQHDQVCSLIKHAVQTVPFYTQQYFTQAGITLNKQITWEDWRKLPITDRTHIKNLGLKLKSSHPPELHGNLSETHSSGFTDTPIAILETGLNRFFRYVYTLRDHFWFKRNFNGKLATISGDFAISPGKTETSSSWGPATEHLLSNAGPCVMMNAETDIHDQAAWLERENPEYLLTYPTNLMSLAQWFRDENKQLTNLQEIRTYGEVVTDELRVLCQSVWNVPITDIYSAQEVGHIALQCPESGYYHIQSENLLVEILDENGMPCNEDEIGRVVITTLQNFAMPLFRYFIGDYAMAGGSCSCGRGLPVIKKILGRGRNMIKLPDGSQCWPAISIDDLRVIATVEQFQIIQKDADSLEVRLVVSSPLTTRQKDDLTNELQKILGFEFKISYSFCEKLESNINGIFEYFISELSP